MERSGRSKSKRDSKGRSKSPKVPIKTYRWEDIRRARRRGGYPWTYLYKGPLNEHVDAEQYTMNHYRRTKSSSPMSGVEIHEMSANDSDISTNLSVDISEPNEPHMKKMQRESSLIIEELPSENDPVKEKDSIRSPDEVQALKEKEKLTLSKESCVDSMGSADSISQYLDKEERVPPVNNNSNGEEKVKEEDKSSNGNRERAKSEETTFRKRKLSAESSYSRISLSKLAVMKRLREAKNKIRVPNISFHTKRGMKKRPSPPKETKKDSNQAAKSEKEPKKDAKKLTSKLTDEKPVYIYIPLKPPQGETDEFSQLENSSISNDKEPTKTNLNNSNNNNLKENLEPNKNLENTNDEPNKNVENTNDKQETKDTDKSIEIEPKIITKKPPLKINPAFKKFLKDVRQLKDIEMVGNQSKEEGKETEAKKDVEVAHLETKPKIVETFLKTTTESKVETEPESDEKELKKDLQMEVDVIPDIKDGKDSDSEMELDLSEQEIDDQEKEDFDKLFSTQKEIKETIPVPGTSRNVRSKSVEPPQRKRRLSIDSSYSRKSLSKLGIIKKLNEAKEKIKSTLSLSNLFRKDSKTNKEQEAKTGKKSKESQKSEESDKVSKRRKSKPGDLIKPLKKEPPKDVKPVYIHIPLKPPEGQKDEFSHLEFESKENNEKAKTNQSEENNKESETTVIVQEETLSVGTPESLTVPNDIQIIFLTPPSDDETLDEKTPDIPETPSSDDVKFFSGKITELRQLAQHAADKISPETKKHQLETVTEESRSERSSTHDEISIENQEGQLEQTLEPSKETTKDGIHITNKDTDKVISTDSIVADDNEHDKEKQPEKMLIDEEDGLNEPTNKHEDLKPSLKSDGTTSPVLKKKVSFKRKTKVIKDTGDYEEIQAPKSEIILSEEKSTLNKTADVKKEDFLTQSMSVDEEKTYLDQKIIKDTSLEEDYNQWSKKDDHEYEPVNPPDEVTVLTSPQPATLPTVKIIDTEIDPGPRVVVVDVKKVLESTPPIVQETRKPIFHFHESDEQLKEEKVEEKATEDKPKQDSGPNKFQIAFKHRTDQLKAKTNQLKTKLQNVKTPQFHKPNIKKPDFKKLKIQKPNIHLPKIPDTVQITLPFGLSKDKQTKHITSTTTTVSSKSSKPTFSFSSGKSSRSSFKNRQASTESNAGDDKKPVFDFSTFPKFMRKKAKPEQESTFATLPKQKKETKVKEEESHSGGGSVRVPLHSEDSMESRNSEILNGIEHEPQDDIQSEMTQMTSPRNRYAADADIDAEFEKENREINLAEHRSRWQHGSFRTDENDVLRYQPQEEEEGYELEHKHIDRPRNRYNTDRIRVEEMENENNRIKYEEYFGERNKRNEMVTDLDNLDDNIEEIKSQSQSKDGYSSEGSVSLHRKGIWGKIDVDSDEFFVVHEIHEGMKTPANTLLMNEYDPVGSNRSLQEAVSKRKEPIKKPKRKKTPHVSQEQIPCDEESVDDLPGLPPSRPKRRSKKRHTKKEDDDDFVIPYQETISLHEESHGNKRLEFPRESLGILGDDEDDFDLYENEKMAGKEQPDILVTDPYKQYEFERRLREIEQQVARPEAPPRRHRSLKSLTVSENESISEITKRYMDDDISLDASNIEELIIPTTSFQQSPPKPPSRRSRSHGSSASRTSLPPSSRDEGSILETDSYTLEGNYDSKKDPNVSTLGFPSNEPLKKQWIHAIKRDNYTPTKHSRVCGLHFLREEVEKSIKFYSASGDVYEVPLRHPRLKPSRVPCTEEPCSQSLRDYMGYAIVDKLKMPREPPLPPPRCTTGPRKKRQIPTEQKFSTVPRNHGSEMNQPPVRPLRNYSTLSQVQNTKAPQLNGSEIGFYQEEDKENTHLTGCEEIEDENTKTLQSEPVIQKMKERPLPAPPRPPRKTRTFRTTLKDITSKENIMQDNKENQPPEKDIVIVEETVSTQTDPLPEDFVCEEVPIQQNDVIVEPSQHRTVRTELITPTHYTFEETITHGSLLVQPLNGAKILPDSELIKERRVPIIRAEDDDEPSEPPESFKHLKNPETSGNPHLQQTPQTQQTTQEIQLVKTEKLQVRDLDVERLRVNQLLAGKIVVSEIDSDSIKVNDIQSASGHPFSSKDITLPPEFVQEIIKELQRQSETPVQSEEVKTSEEKKTPIESQQNVLEDSIPPPAYTELENLEFRDKYREEIPAALDEVSKLSTEHNVFNQEVCLQIEDKELKSNLELTTGNENSLQQTKSVQNLKDSSENLANPEDKSDTPVPPLRMIQPSDESQELFIEPPQRPPRQSRTREGSKSAEDSSLSRQESRSQMLEPELDDQPPPRPPQPPEGYYLPSQPPASFYALRAQKLVEDLSENIPMAPRRKRTHQRSRPLSRSKSTSEDSLSPPRGSRLQRHHSEPSIPELTGRLMSACGSHIQCSIKRLINHFNENVLHNVDGQQDMHVCIIILLVLIAGIILLGQNEDKTVIHHHHWEYFNPPRDM